MGVASLLLSVPDAWDAMILEKVSGLRDDGDHDGQARRIFCASSQYQLKDVSQ